MSYQNSLIKFLALQKFMPLHELMIWLRIEKNEIKEITQKFFRNYCPLQQKYINEIVLKKINLPLEVLQYITEKDNFNSFDNEIKKIFNTENNEETIKTIFYLLDEYKNIVPYSGTKNHFKKEIEKIFYNKNLNKKKIFENNEKNSNELLLLSQHKGIDELALHFMCSPIVVEKELINMKVGGFWYNENIRTNSPLFFSDCKNYYSNSELIYLVKNKNMNLSNLILKLHTTEKNLKLTIEQFKNFSDKELIEKIQNNFFKIKKENKNILAQYNIFDVLSYDLNKSFEKKYDLGFFENKPRYLIVANGVNIICKIIGKINDSIFIKKINGDILNYKIGEIKIIKKI